MRRIVFMLCGFAIASSPFVSIAGTGAAEAEVAQLNQAFLDPWNRTQFQLVKRFGFLHQSIPDCCLGTRERFGVTGSLELALTYGLSENFSLSLTIPVGYEKVGAPSMVFMYGNTKIGANAGVNILLAEQPVTARSPRPKLGLAAAIEAYLPTARGPSPDGCERPFCTPMENLRAFRPEETQLWTNDSYWTRVRLHADLQFHWFRVEGDVSGSHGLQLEGELDSIFLFDWVVGASMRVWSFESWLRNIEMYAHVAGVLGFSEPTDRVFPGSPGLEAVLRSASAPGAPFFPDNDLSIHPPRTEVGFRFHALNSKLVPSIFASWDSAISNGVPAAGLAISGRFADFGAGG